MLERKCCTRRKQYIPCILNLKIQTPLNIHEIPEFHLQTPTYMGIFRPRNWLRQETGHPLALSLFANENLSNDKNTLSWLIHVFYKHTYPQIQSNSNQAVCSIFSMCPPFPSLPSSPNSSKDPLSFPNSHERILRCYIQS